MKNYYYCSECDNTVEFGHTCPSYIRKAFNTWLKEHPNAPEAERLRQNPVPRASGASELAELVDELVRLRAENAALTAAVERMRTLYAGWTRTSGGGYCVRCLDTLRALEGMP